MLEQLTNFREPCSLVGMPKLSGPTLAVRRLSDRIDPMPEVCPNRFRDGVRRNALSQEGCLTDCPVIW